MEGKSTESHWSYVEQALKVAISAWPIIFAAVVAQCLKTWATYRVERGVKLMELEQLVGSNSFGSAIKQPLILHRLGLLTLVIFGIWCFSPLGSQVLQHVYTTDYRVETNRTTAHYVNMTGDSRAFTWDNPPDGIVWDQMIQRMAMIYQIPLVSPNTKNNPNQDLWKHPVVASPNEFGNVYVSGLGVPVFFDDTIFPAAPSDVVARSRLGNPQWEKFSFVMSTSMVNFTCPEWTTKKGSDFISGDYAALGMKQSTSGSLLVGTNSSFKNVDAVWDTFFLASLDNPSTVTFETGTAEQLRINETANYSLMECTVGEVFFDVNITCVRTADGVSTAPDCASVPGDAGNPIKITSTSQGITRVFKGVDLWVQSTNPISSFELTTTMSEFHYLPCFTHKTD